MGDIIKMVPKVEKVYVPVTAYFREDGAMFPREIYWEDRVYQIDRLIDCRRCASLKVGGVGLRYTCMIKNKERYLYFEGEGRWFLEVEKRIMT